MVLAPIDTAGINVEVNAIVSKLKVPMCFKTFTNLESHTASNLQFSMDAVSFLIIVEFSMMECHLIGDVKQKFRELMADSSEPFGSLSV